MSLYLRCRCMLPVKTPRRDEPSHISSDVHVDPAISGESPPINASRVNNRVKLPGAGLKILHPGRFRHGTRSPPRIAYQPWRQSFGKA